MLVTVPFLLAASTDQVHLTPTVTIDHGTSMQQNIFAPSPLTDRLHQIYAPKNTKDFVCGITQEKYLCNMELNLGTPSRNFNSKPFAIADEVIGYLPDIFEYKGLIDSTAAFKIGLGIDVFRQWNDDKGGNYSTPERIGRATARGVQGIGISSASNLFAIPIAGAEELTTALLPGDGLVSYTVAYVSANKALSNWSEPYMQKRVFPFVSRLTSMIPK